MANFIETNFVSSQQTVSEIKQNLDSIAALGPGLTEDQRREAVEWLSRVHLDSSLLLNRLHATYYVNHPENT